MKKTYEKPVLVKKGRLSAITAGNGASGPVGPAG
ncbi:lasso RiPP family leader peptide-containing protein [Mesorhizobium amorphae]|nr:lasso RiPP family leader peptide-containing protein [Mesorhizobium amorphae]